MVKMMMSRGLTFIPLLLGSLVSTVTPTNTPWYKTLEKPSWTPPSWVFPVVWTILYFCMGLAASRVYLNGGGLTLFYIQLAVNLMWSPVFFGYKRPKTALWVLYALIATAGATAVQFSEVDATAGYLMIPYMLWLVVALMLNTYIVKANP